MQKYDKVIAEQEYHRKVIEHIIGNLLLPSEFKEDSEEGIDYILIGTKKTMALRIRKPGAVPRETRDFTIRGRTVANKNDSEYVKMCKGKSADLYFYAWCKPDPQKKFRDGIIEEYVIIDVQKFRECGLLEKAGYSGRINNKDGSCFYIVPVEELRKHEGVIVEEFFVEK